MIEVKEAVANAIRFLGEMYRSKLSNETITDIRLEEVELVEDGPCWMVTLSYLQRLTPKQLANAIEGSPVREYKVIALSAETGEIRSMKMKQLA